MKQWSLIVWISLLSACQILSAQVSDEKETTELLAPTKEKKAPKEPKNNAKDVQWFLAGVGGIAFQTALPTYSINSARLNTNSAGGASPFIGFKVGGRYKKKHQMAFMLEKTIVANGFTYSGDYDEGLGVARELDYVFGNVEYSYNLLNTKRFWLGPSIQIGLGVGDNSSSDFYDRGRQQYIYTPQGLAYHEYDFVRAEIPDFVFNYGLGFTFGVEIVPNKFVLGLDLRWLHSLGDVHEYEVNYNYNLETLNFTASSAMENIHLGLQVAFLFNAP